MQSYDRPAAQFATSPQEVQTLFALEVVLHVDDLYCVEVQVGLEHAVHVVPLLR